MKICFPRLASLFSLFPILFLLFTAVFPASPALAAETLPRQYQVLDPFTDALRAPNMNLEKYLGKPPTLNDPQMGLLYQIVAGANRMLVGGPCIDNCPPSPNVKDPNNPTAEERQQIILADLSSRNHGAVGAIMGGIGLLYSQQPVSGVEYIADLGRNAGILGKPAYAQGVGFSAMAPILKLWKTIRNVSYLVLIIVFVVVGFMIMFRTKIDPRTVLSLQEALPGLVGGLILITLSYAIAGLIIDVSEVLTRTIAYVFAGEFQNVPAPGGGTESKVFQIIRRLTDPATLSADRLNVFLLLSWLIGEVGKIADSFSNYFKSIADPLNKVPLLGLVGGGIVSLVFSIAMIQALLKTFFMFLTAYTSIVISVILAPFSFLISGFGKGGIGGWLKSLLANILVFPVSFGMMVIAAIIISNQEVTQWNVNMGIGPFSWFPAPMGLFPEYVGTTGKTVASGQTMSYLVGFGIVLAIPQIGQMIKEALTVKEGRAGVAVGASLQSAAGSIPIVGKMLG